MSKKTDALGLREPLEHRVEPLPREAGPGRDREPRQLEHRVGLLPGEEVAELVGADARRAGSSNDSARSRSIVRGYGSSRTSSSGNAARASSSRVSAGRCTSLWPGMLRDETISRGDVEVLLRRARDGDVPDVRRVERAAEERGQR